MFRNILLLLFLASATAANNLRSLGAEDNSAVAVAADIDVVAEGKGKDKCKDKKSKGKPKDITEAEVMDQLRTWGDGLVAISTAYRNGGDYAKIARDVIDENYNFNEGPTLFKPTVAGDIPFRTTFDGALSYFIGDNPSFDEDKGFATKNEWKEANFEVVNVLLNGDSAQLMGTKLLKLTNDDIVRAQFTMSFIRDCAGGLNIQLHHSSLPYVRPT